MLRQFHLMIFAYCLRADDPNLINLWGGGKGKGLGGRGGVHGGREVKLMGVRLQRKFVYRRNHRTD